MRSGIEYWRSLQELASSPEFEEKLKQEFAPGAEEWPEGLDRRRFLQLMGASLALAGVGACTRQPLEEIVPYVRQPEEIVPGKPMYYATALTLGGYARGVLVESHMGRPTKIEGNPEHPASLGSTDRFGAGLRILSGPVTSPTFAAQMQRILERFPRARWHRWDAGSSDGPRDGALATAGKRVGIHYDFEKADVVVTFNSDFLTTGPGAVRYAHDFMRRRRVREGQYGMNRLYALESTPTATGAVADHRVALAPNDLLGFALALGLECNVHGTGVMPPLRELARRLAAIGLDLRQSAGRSIVIAGDQASMELHALVLAMNARLGNFGKTILATEPVEVDPVNQVSSLRELTGAMRAGNVDLLLLLGGNPVFDAPADLGFAQALRRVPFAVHMANYEDETTELCHWHAPLAHELETWSDARAYDGTTTIMQPLIEPLYRGRSVHELLAVVAAEPQRSSHDIVRAYWESRYEGADFSSWWRRTLHDGVVPESAAPALSAEYQRETIIGIGREVSGRFMREHERSQHLTLLLQPDPTIHDGTFANNGWLQELPKPWTRLTWDNAALIAPATATRLGLASGAVVELRVRGNAVRAPVWELPGQPENVVTLHFGYGRRRVGRVGRGTGFDAYPLRNSAALHEVSEVQLRKTAESMQLACTHEHHSMEGRHLVREGTLDQFRRNPGFAHEMEHHSADVSMYPDVDYSGNAWGMIIDLGACTGCNACVVACNAENNIPVVGKEQVLAGREMHWLRIDRYFHGDPDDPEMVQQPVMCMHCENAPCEVVCPVGATVHSKEGLNEMVYNRCVGTRYCSNNCPYKVRRFNFFQYSDSETEVLKLLRNPDVSVRTRGVMEKCSYCVQRINQARIQAKKENRPLQDGEVVTACQQVCPTDALVFGDINDPNSQVSQLRKQPLHYEILSELNTRARTTYMARVRNSNPRVEGPKPQEKAHG
jgi:molybdopterin-containing oxidoreductase family iron-sulfur binding subunit